MQHEAEQQEQQAPATLKPWIVERSEIAARTCAVWTWTDHVDLLAHLRRIDETASQAVALARTPSATNRKAEEAR